MNDIENGFLAYITENEITVTIFLINGVRLEGTIYEYDNSSILLARDGNSQLVYKNSIATIMPPPKVNYFPDEDIDGFLRMKG